MKQASQTKAWPSWVMLALLVPTLLLLGSLLLPLARHWQASRAYPFQIDAEEGFILGQARTLAQGGTIYPPIDRPPYLVGNYTPFFPWIYSFWQGGPVGPESLPTGRLLVELAALGAALGLGLIVALRTRRLLPALLVPLLLLGTYEVPHWGRFVRVDLPALALTVGGLGVFLLVRPRWGLILSAALFVAAAYTRQTAILAPAACAGALILNDRKRLAWFLIPYAGLGLGLFLWLEWATGGEFYRHVVTYNANRMDWGGWRRLMKNEIWFFYHWWIAALALAGAALLAGWLAGRKEPAEEEEPVGWFAERPHTRGATGLYLGLATLSLLSYAKVGAAPNYALEPLAAAALWGPEALGRLMDRMARPGGRRIRIWAARLGGWGAAVLLVAHGLFMWNCTHRLWLSPDPTPRDLAGACELYLLAHESAGEVFSEEPIFTLLEGKPVLLQPFIMTQLARKGLWRDTGFCDLLRRRRFSRAIVTEDLAAGETDAYRERYTPGMVAALRENYAVEGRIPLPGLGRVYTVWKAKDK